MAIISMRIPALDRTLRSISAVIRAPVEAVRVSVADTCGAVGKSLSAATRVHLATCHLIKETRP